MSQQIESLLELADKGEVVDIWKVVDHLLDLRLEIGNSVDAALISVGVSKDGPSIILGERVKRIVDDHRDLASQTPCEPVCEPLD